jgi:hypothetical protein
MKKETKKIEKARPTYWIMSKQSGKKAGYFELGRALEMINTFREYFQNNEFYIENEMPVDALVVAASYIGTNNKNNEPLPFKGWVGEYVEKRMKVIYADKSNYIAK